MNTIQSWTDLPIANLIKELMASAIAHKTEWKFEQQQLHAKEIIETYDDCIETPKFKSNEELLGIWEADWINLSYSNDFDYDHAVRDAVFALFAYDNCIHLLESSDEEIEIFVKFGMPAAILMRLAVIALNKIKGPKNEII
jgi:hypothetical protein